MENTKVCPKCGSKDTDMSYYVNCRCCRTYEGNGKTCWTAPHCNSCGYTGWGNSNGGMWFAPGESKEDCE